MRKLQLVLIVFFALATSVSAQIKEKYDLKVGLVFQKTESLYWENGVGADFTSDFLLNKQIHLKATYLTSRLGSGIGSNAILQDNFLLGADWRFRSDKDLQIMAGLNAGVFVADYGNPVFDVLPNSSMLLSVETGLVYRFKFPITAGLTVGYNLKSGNGVDVPGSLFPVFYRLSVFYNL